MKRYDGPGPV